MLRKRQTCNSAGHIPFGRGKKWRQERLEELYSRGLTIELDAIKAFTDCIVIEVNMLDYGTEYWLMNIQGDDYDFSTIRHTTIEEKGEKKRKFLALGNALLMCNEGIPLRTKDTALLRKRNIKPLKLITRW